MYRFHIENSNNETQENKIIGGANSDSASASASDHKFKVYNASYIYTTFFPNDEMNKDQLQNQLDMLQIGDLCDYYFSYIINDKIDTVFDSYDAKVKYNDRDDIQLFRNALNESIRKKILPLNYQVSEGSPFFNNNTNSKDQRNIVCNYILDLLTIINDTDIEIDNALFSDASSVVLSEGQYLQHLDTIYGLYLDIIKPYREVISSIIQYDSNKTDYDNDPNNSSVKESADLLMGTHSNAIDTNANVAKSNEILSSYKQTESELEKTYQPYINAEPDIRINSYKVLHLIFINESYSGNTEQKKSFLIMIDERYEALYEIKSNNIFFNNDKMFIQNKATFIRNITAKINQHFDALTIENGIEKLLNIYYAYIPYEGDCGDESIVSIFSELCKKISEFFIKNKNIYNLLQFNDEIVFKMIKNDSVLTLYDIDKNFEHKFGTVSESNNRIIFDIKTGYTIDMKYIKQIILYRYKDLEREIRSLYLDLYNFTNEQVESSNVSDKKVSFEKYKSPQYHRIINKRIYKLNIQYSTFGSNLLIIQRMIKTINFYRVGRLVKYIETPQQKQGEPIQSIEYIGIIKYIEIIKSQNSTNGIKTNGIQIQLLVNTSTPTERPNIISTFDIIPYQNIKETIYILCDELQNTSNRSSKNCWSSKDPNDTYVKIKYQDMDLFDKDYDIDEYSIKKTDISYTVENNQKLIKGSTIRINNKNKQKLNTSKPVSQSDKAQIENMDDQPFTCISIYSIINNDLVNVYCDYICIDTIRKIQDDNYTNCQNKDYSQQSKTFCFLLELVENNRIVDIESNDIPYDILFFITNAEKLELDEILKI
jgi:hypothetical protein